MAFRNCTFSRFLAMLIRDLKKKENKSHFDLESARKHALLLFVSLIWLQLSDSTLLAPFGATPLENIQKNTLI